MKKGPLDLSHALDPGDIGQTLLGDHREPQIGCTLLGHDEVGPTRTNEGSRSVPKTGRDSPESHHRGDTQRDANQRQDSPNRLANQILGDQADKRHESQPAPPPISGTEPKVPGITIRAAQPDSPAAKSQRDDDHGPRWKGSNLNGRPTSSATSYPGSHPLTPVLPDPLSHLDSQVVAQDHFDWREAFRFTLYLNQRHRWKALDQPVGGIR